MPEKYDLIIAGTGFASSFFLKKYLEKNKKTCKVLVLERGRLYPYEDRLATEQGNPPAYKKLIESHLNSYSNPNKSKEWAFDLNFGGSSNCWWGASLRFLPNDFKLKTLYGVGSDWLISYDDLENYYDESERIIGVSGPEQTPFPRSSNYPLPPHSLSSVDKVLQKEYGNLYISQPNARASQPHANRNGCCSNYSCYVCPVNAKFTIENTLGYLYNDERVTLVYQAKVRNLKTVAGIVKSVVYFKDGKEYEAEGEVVALGTNAIFNANILLNSDDTNPLTGAGLCEQRGFYTTVYLDNLNNVGGGSAVSALGYMLYDGTFRKEQASCLIESHNAPMVRPEKGKWRHIAKFKFIFEDIPDNNNRVLKSDDPFKPVLAYTKHSDYTEKAKNEVMSRITDILKPLAIESVEADNYFQGTEFHILSTVRMGKNETDSIVDTNLIHHKYRNLFVLGSSAFPSVSASNPSLTLSALSLRAADKSF